MADLMVEFEILYPADSVVRTALGGCAVCKIPGLLTEDFQDGRHYGPVRVRNPFADLG